MSVASCLHVQYSCASAMKEVRKEVRVAVRGKSDKGGVGWENSRKSQRSGQCEDRIGVLPFFLIAAAALKLP